MNQIGARSGELCTLLVQFPPTGMIGLVDDDRRFVTGEDGDHDLAAGFRCPRVGQILNDLCLLEFPFEFSSRSRLIPPGDAHQFEIEQFGIGHQACMHLYVAVNNRGLERAYSHDA